MSHYIIDVRRPGPRGPYQEQVRLPPAWVGVEAETDEEALVYAAGLKRFGRPVIRDGDYVILQVSGAPGEDAFAAAMRRSSPNVYRKRADGFSRAEEQ